MDDPDRSVDFYFLGRLARPEGTTIFGNRHAETNQSNPISILLTITH
jgi:hypothetical protein